MEKILKVLRRTKDEGRRKKEEGRREKGFKKALLPSSIFHLPSLFARPSSFVSRPSSLVLRPSSFGAPIFLVLLIFSTLAYAEDKTWNADNTQTDWFDATSWLPAGAPSASDDVVLDKLDSSVAIGSDFNLKSLTLGGKKTSTLTVNNFVVGNVKPANATDIAVLNRRNGHLVLKGSADKVTLKGAYKDSEEVVPEEPSFMFYVK